MVLVWAMLSVVVGCASERSVTEESTPAAVEAGAQGPGCGAVPADALAFFPGKPCGLALRRSAVAGQVEILRTAEEAEILATGQLPSPCTDTAMCEADGVDSDQGPLVLLVRRGHESEMPEGTWFGVVFAGRLTFVPLWEGEPSVVDGTREGPGFALVPRVCDGRLALLVERRLAEVSGEATPEAFAAAEGWLGPPVEPGEAPSIETLPQERRVACEPIDLPFP